MLLESSYCVNKCVVNWNRIEFQNLWVSTFYKENRETIIFMTKQKTEFLGKNSTWVWTGFLFGCSCWDFSFMIRLTWWLAGKSRRQLLCLPILLSCVEEFLLFLCLSGFFLSFGGSFYGFILSFVVWIYLTLTFCGPKYSIIERILAYWPVNRHYPQYCCLHYPQYVKLYGI